MMEALVSIICTAYNHEKYIRKTLDSIFEQQASFPFEVIVNDDCSTDKTALILKEYENKYDNLIVVYQTENQFSQGKRVLPELIKRATGKFVAFCECDDYFCDIQKLQKQVDALNEHKDCVACIHKAYRVSESGQVIGFRDPYIKQTIMGIKEMIQCAGRLYSLNSLLCYKDAINDLDDLYYECRVGDIPISLHLAMKGQFVYLNEPMSAYRVASIGSWSRRMSMDSSSALKNMDSFIELMNKVDERTERKYHNEIEERIKSFCFGKAYISKDFEHFMGSEYKPYRAELTIKQKIGFLVRCLTESFRF